MFISQIFKSIQKINFEPQEKVQIVLKIIFLSKSVSGEPFLVLLTNAQEDSKVIIKEYFDRWPIIDERNGILMEKSGQESQIIKMTDVVINNFWGLFEDFANRLHVFNLNYLFPKELQSIGLEEIKSQIYCLSGNLSVTKEALVCDLSVPKNHPLYKIIYNIINIINYNNINNPKGKKLWVRLP